MIKVFFTIAILCLNIQAQKLKSFFPTVTALSDLELGMSIEELLKYRPLVAPFSFGSNDNNGYSSDYTGMVSEENIELSSLENERSVILYKFNKGNLSGLMLAVKSEEQEKETLHYRKELWKMYGSSEIKYVPKINNGVIVKATHEMFRKKDAKNMVAFMSSTMDGIEISLYNLELENGEPFLEKFFDYDRIAKSLKKSGAVEGEFDSSLDILGAIVREAPIPVEPKNFRSQPETRARSNTLADSRKNLSIESKSGGSDLAEEKSSSWLWVVMGILLLGGAVIVLRAKDKR